MNLLMRLLIHAAYYPSYATEWVLCRLGFVNRWDWIDDFVLLGMKPSRRDIARLCEIGITGIVNFCEEFAGHSDEMAAAGIEQLHLPTFDFVAPTEEALLQGLDFLRRRAERGLKTFIHCKAGRGRAATLAVCYVMAMRGQSARSAAEFVRSRRKQIDRRLDRRAAVRKLEARFAARAANERR